MKKIKIPQPYASMIIARVLQTIPDIWGDVKYGEKIFIYADDVAKEFIGDLDYSKSLHRKIYNEFFLDNIPNNIDDFPTQQFIGHVRVYHTGMICKEWIQNDEPTLFVAVPCKFNKSIEDYETDMNILDKAPSRLTTRNIIERKGDRLYVPVGKSIWQILKDPDKCWGVCMFWEKYMESFATRLLVLSNEIEDANEVYFQYKKQKMSFFSGSGVGQGLLCDIDNNFKNKPKHNENGELISTLDFCLDHRSENGVIVYERPSGCTEDLKENAELKNDKSYNTVGAINEEIDNSKEEIKTQGYRPYIRFISTPMGGMTRWKRR